MTFETYSSRWRSLFSIAALLIVMSLSLSAMTTQPNATYTMYTLDGPVSVPVPQNLWKFFSTRAQANFVLAKVRLIDPNATLYDGLNNSLWIPVTYNDDSTKIWVISGVGYVVGNPDEFQEFAGWLYDRSLRPNPFVDGSGGTQLKAVEVAPGLAELHWSPAPAALGVGYWFADSGITKLPIKSGETGTGVTGINWPRWVNTQ